MSLTGLGINFVSVCVVHSVTDSLGSRSVSPADKDYMLFVLLSCSINLRRRYVLAKNVMAFALKKCLGSCIVCALIHCLKSPGHVISVWTLVNCHSTDLM